MTLLSTIWSSLGLWKGSLNYPKKDTKNCQHIRYLDPWVQIYRELEDAISITTKKQFLQSDLGHIEFSCLVKKKSTLWKQYMNQNDNNHQVDIVTLSTILFHIVKKHECYYINPWFLVACKIGLTSPKTHPFQPPFTSLFSPVFVFETRSSTHLANPWLIPLCPKNPFKFGVFLSIVPYLQVLISFSLWDHGCGIRGFGGYEDAMPVGPQFQISWKADKEVHFWGPAFERTQVFGVRNPKKSSYEQVGHQGLF